MKSKFTYLFIMIIGLNHILLLPDGMRRYAIKKRISYYESYEIYFEKILELAKYILIDEDVNELTISALYDYNFSLNPKRLAIDDVFDTGKIGLRNFKKDLDLEKYGVSIRIFGETEQLFKYRPDYIKIFKETCVERRGEKVLNILFNYSGQKELEKIILEYNKSGNQNPTYEEIVKRMFSSNQIGLIFTCGQQEYENQKYAYSNTCMPYLNAVPAKFCTIPKLLPEISKKDIHEGIEGYKKILEVVRKRKYPLDPTQDFDFS